MSRLIALLALIASLTPVAAQTPPPPVKRQIKIDVSPAGQAVVKKYLGTNDPVIGQRVKELQAIGQQMIATSDAPKLDLARLRALMRRQEGIEAAIKRHSNDRMMAMLTELSEPDRLKFVRSIRAAQPVAR